MGEYEDYGDVLDDEYERQQGRKRARLLEGTHHRMTLARIERERRRLDREEERLLSLPAEPEPAEGETDGPVIYFRKTFGNKNIPDGLGWQYVAVRVGSEIAKKRWYLTGTNRAQGAMLWSELLDFVCHKEDETPVIWVATSWEQASGQGQQDD